MSEYEVYLKKPDTVEPVVSHYCPGCSHGIIHRLIAEVLDEMGEAEDAIFTSPVGCAVIAYRYLAIDSVQCAHGRPPATASAIKRIHPNKLVMTYQGDGDLASIGMAEIVHAAGRGEKITTIFVNNGIYGMTGGQMAPTTLPGMRATTCQSGRDVDKNGFPIRVSELISSLDGARYVERVAVNTPANIVKAKKAIKKALELQKAGIGFTMVEILSACPTNWGMSPVDAVNFVGKDMADYYPLGIYKNTAEEEAL